MGITFEKDIDAKKKYYRHLISKLKKGKITPSSIGLGEYFTKDMAIKLLTRELEELE